MWGHDWGTLIWGGVNQVPLVGPFGHRVLLVALLAIPYLVYRRSRSRAGTAAALVLLASVPLAAIAQVTLPYTFQNGTVADADQVNANFSAVEAGVDDNAARIDALESAASHYTVWGQAACGAGDAMLYSGRIASIIGNGGAGDALCLNNAGPGSGWVSWDGGMLWRANASSPTIRGQFLNGPNDVACAVCEGSTYTNWGSTTCAAGYSLVYSGFAGSMSGLWSGTGWKPGSAFCLEASAGSNWVNFSETMVQRAVGSAGSDRVQYQDQNDILCGVCRVAP